MNRKILASRLKHIRRSYKEGKYKQDLFAELLGIPLASYKSLETGRAPFSLERIDVLKEKAGVNPTWLLYGDGEMFLDDEREKSRLIPYYEDIRASAGFGAVNGEVAIPEYLYVSQSFSLDLQVSKTEAIKCSGDSMYPNIKDGDVMFIDRSDIELKDGEVYVVRMNEEVFVKRLFRVPGKILAKSDNENYPAFDIEGDFEILGRVIYSMQRV